MLQIKLQHNLFSHFTKLRNKKQKLFFKKSEMNLFILISIQQFLIHWVQTHSSFIEQKQYYMSPLQTKKNKIKNSFHLNFISTKQNTITIHTKKNLMQI